MNPIQISVWNQAKTPLGLEPDAIIAAGQVFLDQHLAPIWGYSAKLVWTDGPVAGTWGATFMETADAPGALAYHDVASGLPISKIFVATTLQAGGNIFTDFTHEIAEALGDPWINLYAQQNPEDPATPLVAVELCDEVEETTFDCNGLPATNFLLPAYFNYFAPAGSKLDYLGVLKTPWSIAPGGYQIQMQAGQEGQATAMKIVQGSAEKAVRFAKEDRRGHRSEYRSTKRPVAPSSIVEAMQAF